MHGYVNICFDEPLGSEFAPEPEPEAEPAPEPIAEIEPEHKQPKGRQPAKAPYDNLGYLIDHLRERGYRLEDIAILVNKNTEGGKVIAALLAHNARMKAINPAYRPIELLSEESLKITESPAVQVILAVLRTIGRGFLAPESAVKTPVSKVRKYELTQFVANFHCLRAAKPDMPLEELLKSDLEQALPPEVITSMLASLPATTLPALVEGIAARFTADLGDNQTPYIAAFQDTVIDYCENYTPDVASFLSWWDKNGDLISIGAPSDAKAVRVMTIHKSKGLEFPVVIMPLANWSIEPDSHSLGKTMLWIPTPGSLADALKALPNPPACRDIPGNIPITPAFSMADSLDPTMRASYADFAAKHIVDQLNKLYVAFTRAICELHVYAPFGKDSAKAKTHPLGELLNLAGSQIMAGNPAGIGAKLKLTPEDTDFQQNRYLRCGEPQYPKENPEKTKPSDTIIINQYVNSGPAARLVTQTS